MNQVSGDIQRVCNKIMPQSSTYFCSPSRKVRLLIPFFCTFYVAFAFPCCRRSQIQTIFSSVRAFVCGGRLECSPNCDWKHVSSWKKHKLISNNTQAMLQVAGTHVGQAGRRTRKRCSDGSGLKSEYSCWTCRQMWSQKLKVHINPV